MTAQDCIIRSPWLGDIAWDDRSELLFPNGLPGFEHLRRMVPVEIPAQRPLIYLQSLEHAGICFVCLPVFTIDAGFRLQLCDEDKAAMLIPDDCRPEIGVDVLCLGLLMPAGETVQTNLSAPVVINLHTGRGVQCVTGSRARSCFQLGDRGDWEPIC